MLDRRTAIGQERTFDNPPFVKVLALTTLTSCPVCSGQIERSIHGGLFVDRCLGCGWESSGTCSPTVEGMSRSVTARVSVRWESPAIGPNAIEVLRELSPAAKSMRLAELSRTMISGRPFELGMVPAHRLAATLRTLADAGYLVIQEVVR